MRSFSKLSIFSMGCAVLLSACGTDDKIQEGARVTLNDLDSGRAVGEPVAAVRLDGITSTSWPQHLGRTSHESINATFDGTPNLITRYGLNPQTDSSGVSIPFFGGSRDIYGAATPVIVDGRIYHYDSSGTVHAVNMNGQLLWSRSLVPPGFSSGDGLGGGIAYSDGMLYVTTGYGEIVALRANDGERKWSYVQKAPIHKPPLVSNGMVIAVSEGSNAVALTQSTGQVVWRHFGDPNNSPTRLNAGVPAARDGKVAISYANGTIVMLDILSGQVIWQKGTISDAFSGQKSVFSDVTGDVVIGDNEIIVGTASGILALEPSNGAVIWNQNIGTKGPLIVSGNSVFGLTGTNQVFRLSRSTGALDYKVELPLYKNTQVIRTGKILYGDIRLAGGALWVATNRSQLLKINPSSGQVVGVNELEDTLETAPIFSGGVMVSVSDKGQLLAYR